MNDILVVLAFDFGKKSIGVAVGQNITGTACPLNALKARNGIPDWNNIGHLIKEWQPGEIVVGLPLNINNSNQSLYLMAQRFASKIYGRFGVMVKLHDEHLSTVAARNVLFEYGGFSALNDKGRIDSVSAVIILESYLEYNHLI